MDPARLAAMAAGERHYYSAKPCKNGHVNRKGVTATGACLECSNEAAKRWQQKQFPERKPRPPKQERLSPRKQAQRDGEPFYQMSAPCKNGHLGRRHTATASCEQCLLETAAQREAAAPPPRPRWKEDPAYLAALAAGAKIFQSETPCTEGHTGPRRVVDRRCCECIAKTLRASRARPEAQARANESRRARRQTQRVHAPRPPGPKKGSPRIFVALNSEELPLDEACNRAGIARHSVMNDVSKSKGTHQASFDRLRAAAALRAERARLRAEGKLPAKQGGAEAEAWRARLEQLKADLPPPSDPKRKKRGQLRVDGNHYIDKEQMLEEILTCQAKGRVTNAMGAMLLLLIRRYFLRRNWRGYSCVSEFRDAALLQCMSAVFKFSPAKSRNPFAYVTEVAKNAALKVLAKEKIQWQIVRERGVLLGIDLEEQATGATTHRRAA